MSAGRINIQANDGKILSLTAPEGMSENTVGTVAIVEDVVSNNGDQIIAGIKTFSSSPIVPTPTTDMEVSTKKYVDEKPTGFKNYIINGKKAVNQRGLTSTDNSYNQDRWYKAGNDWFQGIEGNNNLVNGKTYTLSWEGVATASYYVGTATSSTINSQTFTAITNGGNFVLSITAGQNLWIKFVSDATGSTFNFVQLEDGNVATPFEHRPYGLELSLCQRYYFRSKGFSGQQIFGHGRAKGTSNSADINIVIPTMRTAPTFSYSSSNLSLVDGTTGYTITSLSLLRVNSGMVELEAFVSSGLTAYRPYSLFGLEASNYLDFSAEL